MLRTPASTWRNGSSRFDDEACGAAAAVFSVTANSLVEFYNTAFRPSPMKQFRRAAVRECHHDVHGIRRYSVGCGLCRG
jgi:hypothetical protein